MKKIFDIICVLVTVFFVTCGLLAMCNFIASDVEEMYGSTAGVVTFFGSFVIVCVCFARWTIWVQRVR